MSVMAVFRNYLGLMVIIVFIGHLAASRAEGQATVPFACDGEFYVIQGDPGRLFQIDGTVIPFTNIAVGPAYGAAGYRQNALGFNRADGFMYAYAFGGSGASEPSSQIVRLDSVGDLTALGAPTTSMSGSLSLPFLLNAGDINDTGTEYYVTGGAPVTGPIHTILLPTVALPAQLDNFRSVTITPTPAAGAYVLDWAYNRLDGLLYGGSNLGFLATLDPVTGERIDKPSVLPALMVGTSYGASWFNAAGNLFIYENTGTIYRFDDPTVAAPVLSDTISAASSPGNNDGAACPQGYIGIAKDMTGNLMAGLPATVTITYVIENFSAVTINDLSAMEDLTAVFGTHGSDWTFTSIGSSTGMLHNPAFDGHNDFQLTDQAPMQSLAASTTATITVMISLILDTAKDMNGDFINQVVVLGTPTGIAIQVSDLSTDGADPDPNGDGSPDERVPTIINIMDVPVVLSSFDVE